MGRARVIYLAGAAAALLLVTSCGDGGPVVFPSPDDAAPSDAAPSDGAGDDAAVESVADTVERAATSDAPASTVEPTSSSSTTTVSTVPALPPPTDSLEGLRLQRELVIEIDLATAVAWSPDEPGMYVTSQDGFVYRVDGTDDDTRDVTDTVVLDLSADVTPYEWGSERGLLGLAFHPRNGRMFLNYTDRDSDTRVVSYKMDDGAPVPRSIREHLVIDQPGIGHNGGHLLFDDEGNLYIGSGDGGGSNGLDAQDTTKLFGAILRITPTADGYTIPPDNPFADGAADQPEVWVRGLRNPWNFSLDEPTGDVWIGDVGNAKREEIDLVPGGESGLNFGWRYFEGTEQIHDDAPDGLTPPVHDYPRTEGIAVIGGHVYRGAAIPELQGAYVFGDLAGPLWAIGEDGVATISIDPLTPLVNIAEGPDGELYLVSQSEGIHLLLPG